jgi:cystathionine beta-lyase/cystathionine gamma-synthase
VPVNEPGAILSALREHRPQAALFETVSNGPEVLAPADFQLWHEAGPETVFIIDNSAQSHLCRWFGMAPALSPQLLVVESAVKYLTQECMAGVVYGAADLLDRARSVARATGQQLQQKAFSYLCEAEAENVAFRLSLHSRNVRRFVTELAPRIPEHFEYVRPLDDGGRGSEIFRYGVGALVFLRLRGAMGEPLEETADRHRALLHLWRANCQEAGLDLPIRAGFGWNETAARVYESRQLNRSDAPTYLRATIGIEPEEVVCAFAQALASAASEIALCERSYASLG